MRSGIAVAVLALTVSSAGAAYAQATSPQERISAVLARARQASIPVSLLESKIAEGRAKGVSQERIAAAIERRFVALERASQALRGEPDAAASLAVGADAIESGVSEAVLKALAESAPRDRRNVAIATLTELVTQGQAPERALGRVRNALKGGPDALSNLPGETSSGRGNSGADGQQRGNSGKGSGSSSSGGGGGGGGGPASGPPAAVPAPGKPPQAERPDNPGRGNGQPNDPGQPGNPGRGNPGGGGDNPGGGNPGGGNPGNGNPGNGNPGRGGQ
jgi:uncharacterized membrane protein YgcG